jgi:hypothetical protein
MEKNSSSKVRFCWRVLWFIYAVSVINDPDIATING